MRYLAALVTATVIMFGGAQSASAFYRPVDTAHRLAWVNRGQIVKMCQEFKRSPHYTGKLPRICGKSKRPLR